MKREPKVHQRAQKYNPWWTECGAELSLLPTSRVTDKLEETTCKTCRRISEGWEDGARPEATEGHGD